MAKIMWIRFGDKYPLSSHGYSDKDNNQFFNVLHEVKIASSVGQIRLFSYTEISLWKLIPQMPFKLQPKAVSNLITIPLEGAQAPDHWIHQFHRMDQILTWQCLPKVRLKNIKIQRTPNQAFPYERNTEQKRNPRSQFWKQIKQRYWPCGTCKPPCPRLSSLSQSKMEDIFNVRQWAWEKLNNIYKLSIASHLRFVSTGIYP